MGASASEIPYSLYKEIMQDIAPAEIEEIDITIKLANRDTISPMGIVRDVEVLCGKTKYPADFLVLGSPQDSFCPIIFARPDSKNKHRFLVGMHVISIKIGDHCYHGLCDMGASAGAIPHSLYKEVMHDIAPAEIEEIDVTIKLANRDTISIVGIVRDVEVLCGKVKYPAHFLVLGSPQDNFCPIIFGRPFLNTVIATIDCKRDVVTVGLDDTTHEFNFF